MIPQTHRLDAELPGRRSGIPTTLWTPIGGPVRGLILVGHGGQGHRDDERMRGTVEMLAAHQCASLLIDGPVHGERRSDGGRARQVVQAEWRRYWHSDPEISAMVADWDLALAWALARIGDVPVGYHGLSMGTLYGLPLLARTERIVAAVLGMWGPDNLTGSRLMADAVGVQQPLWFYQRWDDQLFDRQGQLDLFDSLGAASKHLVAEPGQHAPPGPTTAAMLLEQLLMTVLR